MYLAMALQYASHFLVLVTLTATQADGVFYYVAPNVTDCHDNTPCNTLSHYASSTSLQLTDSVFYFMPGTHRLQQTWTIENASNLTLTGPSPDSKPDLEAFVECTVFNADPAIQMNNGSSIIVKNLFIQDQGTALTVFSCNYTNYLELINLMFDGGSTCLDLLNCSDFLVTDSNFKYCGIGIRLYGPFFGKMTKLKLLYIMLTVLGIWQLEHLTLLRLLEWMESIHPKINLTYCLTVAVLTSLWRTLNLIKVVISPFCSNVTTRSSN